MIRRLSLWLGGVTLAAAVAACGGGGYSPPSTGGGGGTGTGGNGSTPPPVSAMTIGLGLPTGPMGTVNTPPFGVVGGYTQQTYSQVLAFPPGTVVTIKNLSTTNTHTLNVLSTSSFPASPALSATASGGNTLGDGFASGTLTPGASMQVTLSNPGTYYIGCFYHYAASSTYGGPSMRDVLQVSANATPGPQATPQPGGGGGTGGTGYGGY